MAHQIIDNRNKKLAEEISIQLDHTSKAKIAVGYFYLSGLKTIQDKLRAKEDDGSYGINEIKLLIGNTGNQLTIEELAQRNRRPEHIEREIEKQHYYKDRGDTTAHERRRRIISSTVNDVKEAISELDHSNENETLIGLINEMVTTGRLKVKVYTKSRLHAKAYILDFKNPQPNSKGIAIVGSSNLSLAGFTNNTELNVYVHDNGENHDALTTWFDELWAEAEEFDSALMTEVQESWAMYPATPYDIYMKTLYTLLKDRLEGGDDDEFLWHNEITQDLTDFQRNAVKQLNAIIRQYNGAFASDVVGVGKSFIGAAVVKHFVISEGVKPLIICPKTLEDMWKVYNAQYSLNAEIIPMSLLKAGDIDEPSWNFLHTDRRYNDRNFVLIDESHNFRHHTPQRYQVLQDFIQTGQKKVLLMTATPRNKSANDVYNQIRLFHSDDKTFIPISPPNLKEYFKVILNPETPIEKSASLFRTLLQYVLVRRTRNCILRWYGYDSKTNEKVDPNNFDDYITGKKRAYIYVGGKHRYFPKRNIDTVTYSIEDTYKGLYSTIRKHFGKAKFNYNGKPITGELTYARFALWHYVQKDKQKNSPYKDLHRAGVNLRGLMRVMLFKRFESSIYAFRQTIGRLVKIHKAFIKSLDNGIVPAGEKAQSILYGADIFQEADFLSAIQEATKEGNYDIKDFDTDRLISHIWHDLEILEDIQRLVGDDVIPPKKDAKLQRLKAILKEKPLNDGKVLIFSESAETVDYLYENLNPKEKPEIQKASSGRENKNRLVKLFAPKANNYELKPNDIEVQMVIATDVLSEGLNLQDCDKIINYDLHWNPVRMIQRFGRIDRIGSEHEKIYGFNFLPETELDRNLNLHEIVHQRIQEIHDTIGEDSEILDNTEQINSEAMYAIYEGNQAVLSGFEDGQDYLDLNEAEEILRQLKVNDPDEFGRISKLRDGIRSAQKTAFKNIYVFCKAEKYSQLYLLDKDGGTISRDLSEILGRIKIDRNAISCPLPPNMNELTHKVMKEFTEEVYGRYAEQLHMASLTKAQQYIIRELRLKFENTVDENLKAEINLYDKIIRQIDREAVKAEFNRVRKNSLTGMPLIRKLQEIYTRHNLAEMSSVGGKLEYPIPKIICSEVL